MVISVLLQLGWQAAPVPQTFSRPIFGDTYSERPDFETIRILFTAAGCFDGLIHLLPPPDAGA